MAELAHGVHWCARDLGISPIGNHHFILLVTESPEVILGQQTKEENVEGYSCRFCTVGGFKQEQSLVMKVNDEDDVKSVREYVDPNEHTSILTPDFDLEPHFVAPPAGSVQAFVSNVIQLASNFRSHAPAIPYSLPNENCSAWVNTLFKVAGVSAAKREILGEFFGVDWGEEDLISESYFQP